MAGKRGYATSVDTHWKAQLATDLSSVLHRKWLVPTVRQAQKMLVQDSHGDRLPRTPSRARLQQATGGITAAMRLSSVSGRLDDIQSVRSPRLDPGAKPSDATSRLPPSRLISSQPLPPSHPRPPPRAQVQQASETISSSGVGEQAPRRQAPQQAPQQAPKESVVRSAQVALLVRMAKEIGTLQTWLSVVVLMLNFL